MKQRRRPGLAALLIVVGAPFAAGQTRDGAIGGLNTAQVDYDDDRGVDYSTIDRSVLGVEVEVPLHTMKPQVKVGWAIALGR